MVWLSRLALPNSPKPRELRRQKQVNSMRCSTAPGTPDVPQPAALPSPLHPCAPGPLSRRGEPSSSPPMRKKRTTLRELACACWNFWVTLAGSCTACRSRFQPFHLAGAWVGGGGVGLVGG